MINIISLNHYLLLAAILFTIAIVGLFMNRKNLISILMSIELMLLAVNINFVAFSAHLQDITGQIFVIFILTIAASEIAIGLAIVLLYFRKKNSLQLNEINEMRG